LKYDQKTIAEPLKNHQKQRFYEKSKKSAGINISNAFELQDGIKMRHNGSKLVMNLMLISVFHQ
jgi:hypothetical protein